MTSDELDELYDKILISVGDDDKERIEKFVNQLTENIAQLSDYSEIDTDKWGFLVY